MVLKFIRDHAWKFPSRPPLTLMRESQGILEDTPESIQGSAGNQGPYTPNLSNY